MTAPSSPKTPAAAPSKTTITVVVPTYQEVKSIPHLVARLATLRDSSGLDLEVLLMDDDSKDGSAELVASLALPWLRLVTRKSNRGLSYAVLDGFMLSTRETLVVMDADLSHPPEKIPELLIALDEGNEVAVGSRFAEGGSTADDWGFLRWLNSRVATLLALPLTTLSDPMSGFFAVRRSTILAGRNFNPVGYKILLEVIIKCRCRRVIDVPIHFDNRRFGESKLSFAEELKYIKHLRRLYMYKYGTLTHLVQFLVVGLSGLVVNLGALTLLLRADVEQKRAVAMAIVVSMVWNFVLNRRFSFSYARDRSIVSQFVGFVAACSVGAVVNYFTTIELWELTRYKQLAAMIGVLAGTTFNFVASRFVIFRTKHVKP
ncbi:MAG: dolichol-phosphate mannosyltransferase [Gammaproteobacteria bacterium]|jgi:dolichol-phosphate mannosyltransferase|nr:dolichol-phosphate mannosyltransferase [Gammaproteobacteria bacterium]